MDQVGCAECVPVASCCAADVIGVLHTSQADQRGRACLQSTSLGLLLRAAAAAAAALRRGRAETRRDMT